MKIMNINMKSLITKKQSFSYKFLSLILIIEHPQSNVFFLTKL